MISGFALKSVEVFQHVAVGALRGLQATARRRHVRPGEPVLSTGAPSTTVWVVEEGLLRAVAHSPTGNAVTVDLLTKHDVFGYLGPFVDGRELTDVESLTAATVVGFDSNRFWALESRQPSVTQALRHQTAARIGRLIRLRAIATERSDRRICALLLFLMDRLGARIPATRSILATLAGLTPESVTRALAPLSRRGALVLGRGFIQVLDPKGLRVGLDGGSAGK